MNTKNTSAGVILCLACLAMAGPAAAQPASTAAPANLPADPWPRDLSVPSAAVLMYQPQVNRWVDNQIDLRAAMALKPTGAPQETFGVVFATARTQVDKATRTVVFENLQLTKIDFPTLRDRGAGYTAAIQAGLQKQLRTMSLDRLDASLAASGVKPTPVQVQNDPPQVVVSYRPAILVPVNGAPVWKPVPESSRFQRVINTSALILKGGLGDRLYMHVYDGWLSADSIAGPWTLSSTQPLGMDDVARKLAQGARSICSTAGRRPTPSRRWPAACRPSSSASSPPS